MGGGSNGYCHCVHFTELQKLMKDVQENVQELGEAGEEQFDPWSGVLGG